MWLMHCWKKSETREDRYLASPMDAWMKSAVGFLRKSSMSMESNEVMVATELPLKIWSAGLQVAIVELLIFSSSPLNDSYSANRRSSALSANNPYTPFGLPVTELSKWRTLHNVW